MGKIKDSTIPEFDANSHYLECPLSAGCQCPWMRVCEDECGCICEYITAYNKRMKFDADAAYKQGLTIAMLRVQMCLSWDDEKLDDDGFHRQVMWKDDAINAIRAAFDNASRSVELDER